jgi:hypothetical protein
MTRIEELDAEIGKINAEIDRISERKVPRPQNRKVSNILIALISIILIAMLGITISLTYSRISGFTVIGENATNETPTQGLNETLQPDLTDEGPFTENITIEQMSLADQMMLPAMATGATITTDKVEYYQNEAVVIAASGFSPSTQIQIDIKDPSEASAPGYPQTATTDETGSLSHDWNTSTACRGNYTVTGTEGTSSAEAQFLITGTTARHTVVTKAEIRKKSNHQFLKDVTDAVTAYDGFVVLSLNKVIHLEFAETLSSDSALYLYTWANDNETLSAYAEQTYDTIGSIPMPKSEGNEFTHHTLSLDGMQESSNIIDLYFPHTIKYDYVEARTEEDNGCTPFQNDTTPPSMTVLSPFFGQIILVNGTLNITVFAEDDFGIRHIYAYITYPNSTTARIELLKLGDHYQTLFNDTGTSGLYYLNLSAIDLGNNTNTIGGLSFYVAPYELLNLFNESFARPGYSMRITGANSQYVNVSIDFYNHTLVHLDIYNLLLIGRTQNLYVGTAIGETGFLQTYSIDLSDITFSEAFLTVPAQGDLLYKCIPFNFTEGRCADRMYYDQIRNDLVQGRNYTVMLTPTDPGFGELSSSVYYMFNATDPQYATYRRLLPQAVGPTTFTSTQLSVETTGLRCWTEEWIASNWTETTAVNGTWNFTVYGYCNHGNPTAYLFSRILKVNSTGEYNFRNTTQSATDMCTGGTTISTISYSLPYSSFTDLQPGERLGVGYCINVTATQNNRYAVIYWEGSGPSNIVIPTAKWDDKAPNVTLISPANLTTTYATVINFTYNVSDANPIANCSLIIDGAVNKTNTTVVRNTPQNFTTTLGLGTYNWWINCTDVPRNMGMSETRQITITAPGDLTPPTWSNNKTWPTAPATYNSSQQYQFNVTWVDNINLTEVKIEHNFTGTAANYTVTTKNGNEYYYDYSALAAGTYYWKGYGTDNSSNRNATDTWTYIVNKAASEVNLLLNGTDSNFTILQGQYVNMTGYLVRGEGDIYLYLNGSLINSGAGPLTNITRFVAVNNYSVTVQHNATRNYTAGSETHYVIVLPDDYGPNVTNVSAAPGMIGLGDAVNISAKITDNVYVENATAMVRYPNSTIFYYLMSSIGEDVYSYILTTTLAMPLGTYNVTIIAYDPAGKLNNTEKTYFVTQDSPPVFNFYNATPDPVAVNHTIRIYSNVTDNMAVDTVIVYVNNSNHTTVKNITSVQRTINITNSTGDCTFSFGSTAGQANSSDNYRSLVPQTTCGWNVADLSEARFAGFNNITVYVEHVAETGVTASSSTLYVGNATSTSAYGSRVLSTFEGNQNQLENFQGSAVTGEGTDSYVTSSRPATLQQFNNMQVRILNGDAGGEDLRGADRIYLVVNYNITSDVYYLDINATWYPMGWNNYTIYANDTLGQWSSVDGTFRVDYQVPPVVNITAPYDGIVFMQGDDINVTGYATDLEDGNITGNALVWSSSINGIMGSGNEITFATLSPGSHTITLTATDSFGLSSSDSINLTVTPITCPGMETGIFTLVNITIDGDATDWDPVLQNPANQISDGLGGVDDLDTPQSADRDLRRYAVTWNEEWLWMYVRRSSSGTNVLGVDTYFDQDQNQLLDSTDRVLVADWTGSNRLYDTYLFDYSPVNASGDQITGDGVTEPGSLTNQVDLETGVLGGTDPGIVLEYRVRWSELGMPACTPIIAHVSSVRGTGKSVPNSVEDNVGRFDSRVYDIKFYPDSIKSGKQGTTVTHYHALRNIGNLADLYNLNITGTTAGYNVTVYYANGTQLTDTDGDGRIDTGYIQPSYGVTLQVKVSIPTWATSGDIDTTTVTAYSKLSNITNASVVDTTIVGAIAIIPRREGLAMNGTTIEYSHIIYNNDVTSTVNVNATSNQGYIVTLHYLNGTLLTDTNGDTVVDVGQIAGGWFKPLLVKIQIPPSATIGTIDNTTITANSTFGEYGRTYDKTTIAPHLLIVPNITRAAGQGTSIYLIHNITYVSNVTGVVDLVYNQTQNFTFYMYHGNYITPLTDTNGNGIIDAGLFGVNGYTKTIVAKLNIPATAAINTTDLITYTVFTNQSTYNSSAKDNVSVQKLVTYKDSNFQLQSYYFKQTELVYAQAYALDMAWVYFQYIDPNATVRRLSPNIPVDTMDQADDNYYLNTSDLSGQWTLVLYNKQGSAEITRISFWVNTPPIILTANYTPPEVYEGDIVNFTANVTAGELRWFPNETVVKGALLEIAGKNYSMTGPGATSGIGLYNFTLDTANITFGTYTYKIWAYDNFTFYNVSVPWTGQIVIKPYNFTNVSGVITNTRYQLVPSALYIRNSTGHLVWTDDETYSFKLYRGEKYNITIVPNNGSIKEITYINVTFPTILINFTRLEDSLENETDRPDEIKNWTEAITWWTSPMFYYAQAKINFTYGAGQDLYFWKCSDWNFDNRTCNNNNFVVIQNLTDGPGWATIYLSPGDPGAGAGKAPDYNESVKVWDVTGINSTGRRDNGTFVGEYYDLQSINFTIGKAYRLEVFVTQITEDAVGILRDPYYNNIQDDWTIDTTGVDAPNIIVINGSVVIDPFVATITAGSEPGTRQLTWDSNPPNKTVSDIDTNETVKLWFVVDIPINASNETHAGHFLGKSKGHDAEITNNLTTLVGRPPCTPNLTFPNNGNNTLINRTVAFIWQQACDPDNQTLTYSINITSQYCSDIYDTNITFTNYTPVYELGTYDECGTYNWSVRAYDGYYYGNYSDSWNFSIMPYLALFMPFDTVDFGDAQNDETNDTTDNNPYPFMIQNDGNVFADIINATRNQSFFTGASAKESDFQIMAANSTETGAFNWTGSATWWINLTTLQTIIDRFNWHDTNDSVEIEVKVHVPIDEPSGVKITGLVFYGEQS